MKKSALILWDAIKRNDLEKINQKLDEGFPVDNEITDSHLNALSYACTRCVDPNIYQAILSRSPDINTRASGGKTALHFAAISGNTVALQILLAQPQLDKNAQTFGLETPLMAAVKGGSIQAVALILNSGANPFQKNGLGQSALDIARTFKKDQITNSIEQAVS